MMMKKKMVNQKGWEKKNRFKKNIGKKLSHTGEIDKKKIKNRNNPSMNNTRNQFE